MEIKIQSLEQIHEAAREFISAMGDNTVFALYGKMEQVKRLLSRHFARSSEYRMSSLHRLLPL